MCPQTGALVSVIFVACKIIRRHKYLKAHWLLCLGYRLCSTALSRSLVKKTRIAPLAVIFIVCLFLRKQVVCYYNGF